MEVESKDNHDRTREFVWRRTPKIAKLVNEKLKLAAESLFAPQGVEVVRLWELKKSKGSCRITAISHCSAQL